MPFDLGHFIDRFFQPFNTESRFYWPAVYAVAISLVANVVWYNWRRRGPVPPAENTLKSWAFWTNIVFLIVLMVWIGVRPNEVLDRLGASVEALQETVAAKQIASRAP